MTDNHTNLGGFTAPLKQLEQAVWQQACSESSMNPNYVPRKRFKEDSANAITASIIAKIKIMGGDAVRVNAAGVSRGLKVSKQGYVDAMNYTHSTEFKQTWVSSGAKGQGDISGTILGRSIKVEVKYSKDALKEHQEKKLIQNHKAGGLSFIARDYTNFSSVIEDLFAGNFSKYENKINDVKA